MTQNAPSDTALVGLIDMATNGQLIVKHLLQVYDETLRGDSVGNSLLLSSPAAASPGCSHYNNHLSIVVS